MSRTATPSIAVITMPHTINLQHTSTPELIAFYLPQFHPIAENDAAWGQGFTEWTHVQQARPLFPGHYQPHLPADLGYYDLRQPDVRHAQAALARRYGITAFCYYHYWLGDGRRLLERPFNEVLESGAPDFPFCLCWANDSWTGVWYGKPNAIIARQTYPGRDDHLRHIDWLSRAFHDARYLKVDGKPVFLIFKPREIPALAETLNLWRTRAKANGLPGLHLVAVRFYHQQWDVHASGFDASVTFRLPLFPTDFNRQVHRSNPWVMRHADVKELLAEPPLTTPLRDLSHHPLNYPCVGPNWDNTPRCGTRGIVLHDSTPELFSHSLRRAKDILDKLPVGKRLCYIKAWNEWAEGNHLEPDQRTGHGWLEAVKAVFPPTPSSTSVPIP